MGNKIIRCKQPNYPRPSKPGTKDTTNLDKIFGGKIMEDLIKQEQLKEDRKRVNKFTAEKMAKQNKDKLHEKLEDLFMMYLSSAACRDMKFSQLEDIRKFFVYLIKNL